MSWQERYKDAMKTPKRIQPLVDDGLVDEVIRQLMSGKEATVYLVRCGTEIRCAKVYKEANKRLRRLGVMVDTEKESGEEFLYILNTSSWVHERLKKTAWTSSHRTVLGRLDGAKAYKKNKYYSAGVQGSGLMIPIKNIIES